MTVENNKKKRNILVIGIVFMLIVILSSVYAFYNYRKTFQAFTLTSSGITATFTGGTNEINFENAYPISDSFAISNLNKLSYVDFTVTGNAVNSAEAVKYEIYLTEKNNNTLSTEFVKLYLTDEYGNAVSGPIKYSDLSSTTNPRDNSNGKVIYESKVTNNINKNYKLYMWLDSEYSQNEVTATFSFYVNLYAYNDTSNGIYTVTFDYQDGVTESTTKQVTYGDIYGELPTPPERTGYTFMGWNGKNLAIFSPAILSEDRIQAGITWHATSENIVHVSGTATSGSFLTRAIEAGSSELRKLSAGNYIISSNLERKNNDHVYIYGYYDGDASSTVYAQGIYNNNSKTFTLIEDAYVNIQMMISSGTTIDQDVWVQLEEGEKATEYEPYYITGNTKVVQNKDHTLKAIWKENS